MPVVSSMATYGRERLAYGSLVVLLAACGAKSGLLSPKGGNTADAGRDATAGDAGTDAPTEADAATICPTVATPVDLGIVETIPSGVVPCANAAIDPPCAGKCGNGAVDACPAAAENCDGALGSATCASLGYAGGGPLTCTQCRFNRGACNDVLDATAVTFDRVYQGLGTGGFALAARPDRIALALYSSDVQYGTGAHFVVTPLDGGPTVSAPGCLPTVAILGIDLVAVGSGWLVAADSVDGIDLYTLDANGAPLGARRLPGAHNPRFAARPGAGPLLGFEIGEAQWAALLDTDGSVLWTTKVFDTTYTYTVYDAVFVGDAFLLAKRLEWQDGGVHVARLELDGRLTCVSAPSHSETEYPQIAWDGTRGRLTWSDFSNSADVKHAFIDANGTAGTVTSLGSSHFNPAPVVSSGAGSLVLLGNDTGGVYLSTQLSLARLDGMGALQSSSVFVENPGSITAHRLAIIDGQRAALGWLRHSADWGVSDGVEIAVVTR